MHSVIDRTVEGQGKKTTEADVLIGKRIRYHRMMVGVSQNRLAEELGLTFQQVQKYEKGQSRVAAARLWNIATILGVPIADFYGGLEGAEMSNGFASTAGESLSDIIATTEGAQLVSTFQNITDPTVRKRVVDVVKAMSKRTVNRR